MPRIIKASTRAGLLRTTDLRRHPRAPRKLANLLVENLETRQMLSGVVATVGPVANPAPVAAIPAPYFVPTSTNLLDAQNGPMANFGTQLVSVYGSYAADFAAVAKTGNTSVAAANALSSAIAKTFPTVELSGSSVNMDINSLGGDFNAFVTKLTSLGMQVTASDASYGIVEGWVPIVALPTIARLPQTEAGHAIAAPTTHSFTGYQGSAYNQAETSLNADAARSQFGPTGTGLTGAGVTVGVISDGVVGNGGLAAEYSSQNLDPNNPVTVVAGKSGSGEEGSAMLESIHDIAPGANLQFASAAGGDLGFMQSIEALYNAGSKIIVDDISYSDEPYFQDGLISQGVDYVTARGATYFSSAGNGGTDGGYLSAFRGVSTTVNTMTGIWDNFNPDSTSTANYLLPVTVLNNNISIQLQFDQPYKTQEPAGATASVTSVVNFYVFNSAGQIVSTGGTDDNVATQTPAQYVTVPTAGNYFVGIELVSGTAPGHVEFIGGEGALAVSQQYANTGGTYYPASYGHEVAANTIGVGATPWWATSPFLGQTPLASESFSSSGPGLIDLSTKGTPVVAQVVQSPQITAPDAGSNVGFPGGSGAGVNTVNATPNTPYNFNPTSQVDYNTFYGTSQAAPNAAAVAALMLQQVPTLSRFQILQAMEMTAKPMNGTAAGKSNVQSGYGLVNAVAAINKIAPPTLAATTFTASSSVTTPTSGQTFNLMASLTGGSGTPTGTVDFYEITANLDLSPTAIVLSAGQASLSISTSTLGSHVYLLTYNGDGTYAKNTAYVVLDVVADGTGHAFVISAPPKSGTTGSTGAGSGTTHSLLFVPAATPTVVPIPMTVSVPSGVDNGAIDAMAVDIASITTPTSNPLVKKHLS